MTRLRCAILDDYLNLALTIADWSKISDRVDVTVFNEPFASPEAAERDLGFRARVTPEAGITEFRTAPLRR